MRKMSNEFVRYSRAGDVFHYRWAARRCLALVHPKSELSQIVIEGSDPDQQQSEGEYVIDVSEYYQQSESKKVKYYQLKHTTVKLDSPFMLSDLKDTIVGFAKRFREHMQHNDASELSFIVVTNRPVDAEFKSNLSNIIKGEKVNTRFKKTIEGYTELQEEGLSKFCALLELQDGHGNYDIQKGQLQLEMAHLLAGTPDNSQIENLVAMVQERVLPNSDGIVSREDVLRRFDISFEKDLFPAPGLWENDTNLVKREQHEQLIRKISASAYPVIVHAPGGVGKSVFCRQLVNSLEDGSFAVAYDCFGAGQYRSRSGSRHRHRDALVQIINELAVKGLCDPLLVKDTSHDSDIMKKFLIRIASAVDTLQKAKSGSELYVLIDAADNAEMAAEEYSSPCFASELLREKIPEGCRVVMLCRTERIGLLKPSSKIVKQELKGFSKRESMQYLQLKHPEASSKESLEFHRLTNGNPRVQSNSLSVAADSVVELLARLGPSGKSVEELIEKQLQDAVSSMKDVRSEIYQQQIDAICIGLSSLPPHIPLEILAATARVTADDVKSFVYDIGRSLWLTENAVQFRDEPTETWFRKTCLAEKENIESYINILEPLALGNTYVAEVLPQLYLQAEQYDKLIKMALSDDFLPEDNPIDARNVRVYRLQFAFRAALRIGNINDAVRIAILGGEHSAGSKRQTQLFQNNVDLLAVIQDKEKVQEIAFKRELQGAWTGSENIYTASLLSGFDEFKGEASGYYRAAINWIEIYYEEHKKRKKKYYADRVSEGDILELAIACLNISGEQECITLLNRFSPKTFIFPVMQGLAKRLIDQGKFSVVSVLLEYSRSQPYYTVAIVSELVKIGMIPEKIDIENCLKLLAAGRTRIKISKYFHENENLATSVISLIEACMHHKLPSAKIKAALKYYLPEKAGRMVSNGNQWGERSFFLRGVAIRNLLDGAQELDLDAIMPEALAEKKKNKNYEHDSDLRGFNESVRTMYPWYLLRAKIICGNDFTFQEQVKTAFSESNLASRTRYHYGDILTREIAWVQSNILALSGSQDKQEISWFYGNYVKDNKKLGVTNLIQTVRTAYRMPHLREIRDELEITAHNDITAIRDEGPDQSAQRYIALSRAVLNDAPQDAAVYFEEAVDIVSKFGDEIVDRWEAVTGLAAQSCLQTQVSQELAYRFIRCSELVGDYVDGDKYWDRSKALALSERMSSGTGIAALSRWRDRNIGRFEYQLENLLIELLESGRIQAGPAWAMCRFFEHHQNERLLELCLAEEPDQTRRTQIFDDAVKLLQIEGAEMEYWRKIKDIAGIYKVDNRIIDTILEKIPQKKLKKSIKGENLLTAFDKKTLKISWNDVFGTSDILIEEQFSHCRRSFIRIGGEKHHGHWDEFWYQIVSRLNEKDLWRFIDILLLSDFRYYQIKSFLDQLPALWKNKASYRKKFPVFLQAIGKKFALQLVTRYALSHFILEFELDKEQIKNVKDGIFQGLATGYEFSDAETYFGFVKLAAPILQMQDAAELADFAIGRFEMHMQEDFGDGPFDVWLAIPEGIDRQLAGFLWSTLGSPNSQERWRAAHAVRAICNLGSDKIVDELVRCISRNTVGAYGSSRFPFYDLHARLYLLIAFSRASKENPQIFVNHKDVFVHYAKAEPHILIQKISGDIVKNLAVAFPELYEGAVMEDVQYAAQSRFPLLLLEDREKLQSWWHENTDIDTEYDFHFPYDFDRYWFEPLGSCFGISGRQVQDIAAEVIREDWKIEPVNRLDFDLREEILWDSDYKQQQTWHDHSDYPKIDNFEFYLSYHSLMTASSKLLGKMPLVRDEYSQESEWEEWISDHLPTCRDGKWLSDFRDPVPVIRPKWLEEEMNEDWLGQIPEKLYYQSLFAEIEDNRQYFNVRGNWQEKNSIRSERITVNSALVSKETSMALMSALQSCDDIYSYKLPDYKERRGEIHSDPFQLKGWITYETVSAALDEYDPYANNISYPAFSVGEELAVTMNLSQIERQKQWLLPGSQLADVMYSGWSSFRPNENENPPQSGTILKASQLLLQKLCSISGCDIIFEVQIKRESARKYGNKDENKLYLKPKAQLFIFTSDGEIKTAG